MSFIVIIGVRCSKADWPAGESEGFDKCTPSTALNLTRFVFAAGNVVYAVWQWVGPYAGSMRSLPSPSRYGWIETDFSLPSSRMRCIYNGVAEPDPTAPRKADDLHRQLGLPAGAFVAGSVGRLVPLKDYCGAVRAVSLLAKTGHDIHLVLIGDGPERERIAAEAQSSGVEERVHLVGHQADPLPWLRILNVYVNSSGTEAMNMGILEAMAAGLPVIATDVGDAAAMLSGAPPAGMVVPPRDPAALAVAISELLSDPRRRAEYAEQARHRYCARYRLPMMVADAMKSSTRSCAGSKPPRPGVAGWRGPGR